MMQKKKDIESSLFPTVNSRLFRYRIEAFSIITQLDEFHFIGSCFNQEIRSIIKDLESIGKACG